MKKLGILVLLLSVIVAVGCSKDDDNLDPNRNVTADFDPLFAQELQKRGYIADAKKITPQEVKGITELDVSGYNEETDEYEGKLTSLRGIEYFESLTKLSCDNNQLTALDVSKNMALTHLYCYSNKLTKLDVGKNAALTWLSCDGNQLTTLDVSKNTALTSLWCKENPGDGSVFPVTAWFDNNSIPEYFPTGSWEYNGVTITIYYRKAE